MTTAIMPISDWQQIRIALGDLAQFAPNDLRDTPISSPVFSMLLCPFGQTHIIIVLTKYTTWRTAKILVYEKEPEYPACFWMRTKEVKTPAEALAMCREQDQN